jgi:hypothetical protein
MAKAPSRRIKVSVSPARIKFREAQGRINRTLWSTEICYGHVLATTEANPAISRRARVWEVFGHAPTQAWYPNRQGELKYKTTVRRFLSDVRENMVSIHRPLMLQFYAEFETYLRDRVPDARQSLIRSFATERFTRGPYRLCLESVIDAEIIRLARNAIAHNDQLPEDDQSTIVTEWLDSLKNEGRALRVWNASIDDVRKGLEKLTSDISRQVDLSPRRGGRLSHEFFFALFSFTILDQLASEIEEALMEKPDPDNWIWRSATGVRRRDLIVQDV